jgi:hypothetical protein
MNSSVVFPKKFFGNMPLLASDIKIHSLQKKNITAENTELAQRTQRKK